MKSTGYGQLVMYLGLEGVTGVGGSRWLDARGMRDGLGFGAEEGTEEGKDDKDNECTTRTLLCAWCSSRLASSHDSTSPAVSDLQESGPPRPCQ